jgi:membrane associated rhomboid family serine protease
MLVDAESVSNPDLPSGDFGGSERDVKARGRSPDTALRPILFPKKGLSATELLLIANVVVAAALFLAWGGDYTTTMRAVTARWWIAVRDEGGYFWLIPTIFMHAGAGHLVSNLIALLAGASAVEFLVGGRWTVIAYGLTGLGAAWVSYLGHGAPPLSVGASGAIFGLLGCAVSFIIRRRPAFNYAQRWKVWRVYVPLFVLLFLPVLAKADFHAHAGGFASGLILGPWLPPHPRVRRLGAVDPLSDDPRSDDPLSDDPEANL